MKPFHTLTTLVAFVVLITSSSCNKRPYGPSVADTKFGLLAPKPWKIETVTLGSVDQTATYTGSGFQLTITGKSSSSFNYSCVGRPSLSPWPQTGTLVFGTDPATQLIRDQGAGQLPMKYSVTATSLQITFNYTGNGYSRTTQVAGDWVFNFTH